MWKKRIAFTASALILALGVTSAPGQAAVQDKLSTSPPDSLRAKKLQQLEQRLAKLEKAFKRAQQQALIEKLRAKAREAATKKPVPKAATAGRAFYSAQRQLSALNPEISVTGDFVGWYHSPEFPGTSLPESEAGEHGPGPGNRFSLREAEFHIISPLDPYTRGKFFLGIPGNGHLHVGEAYMEWINLPTNLNLKIGKFRNQFGQLNRWHQHALPQVDRPYVLTRFLSDEGLSGMGVGANWLLPRLWAHVNELNLEFISGGDGSSFANSGGRERVLVTHLKNYWDVTENAYLEIGVSGALGHNDPEAHYRTLLGGLDINYKWVPAGRSKYRTFEFRAEAIGSRRQTPRGNVQTWGAYAYFQNKLNARWWLGARLDYTELPWTASETEKGASLVFTYWQSEFVFFRFQLSRKLSTFADDVTQATVQAVWSMGPHKHEAY